MFLKAKLQISDFLIVHKTFFDSPKYFEPKYQIHGFTLVELLVVIAIIAVLAGILLPAISAVTERSRSKSALAELYEIQTAIALYEQEHRDFPPSNLAQLGIKSHNQINTGVECLVICLAENQNNGQPYCVIRERMLANTDADISPISLRKLAPNLMTNDLWEFCDPWENPYIYFHFRDLNETTKHQYWLQGEKTGVAPCLQRTKTGQIPGQSRYQIFSIGGDERPATSDDLMVQ